jgi:purine nucleoside permease
MTVSLDALVLPAFDELAGLPDERAPWLDAESFDSTLDVPGVPDPVHYTDEGLGIVPTGVGKSAAAATTTALLASDRLDLSETLVCSVGVAGGPPTDVTIGSVVLAERIVDWDAKVRFDPDTTEPPIARNPYAESAILDLDEALVETALRATEAVDLATEAELRDHCGQFDATAALEAPRVLAGTNCCADELWHGRTIAEHVQWLVEEHDAGTYCVTEMEDFGTALALDRFDHLDRYLSVRGIANFDRPPAGTSPEQSLFGDAFDAGFPLGLDNAVRVARAIIDGRRSPSART